MPADNKFEFLFDPKQFQASVNKIAASLNKLESLGGSAFAKTGDMATKAAFKLGFLAKAGATVFTGLIRGAQKFFGAMGQQIPEIGQTFSIMGEIISRNFFAPMRKFLIPMLQKLLDWTREHRGMFVKWGASVISVFRIIGGVINGVIKLFGVFADAFHKVTGGVFKNVLGDMDKTLNVMVFKIAVIAEFLVQALTPVADFLGTIFGWIVKIGGALTGGFLEGFTKLFDIGTSIKRITDAIEDMRKAFSGLLGEGEGLLTFFRSLGEILGRVVAVSLNLIVDQLRNFITGMANTVRLIKVLKDTINGKEFDFSKLNVFKGMNFEGTGSAVKGAFTTPLAADKSIKDGIVKPDGTVIHTDPSDTIIAHKGSVARMTPSASNNSAPGRPMSVNANINISGMLNVTEGNAAAAGQNFAKGVGKQVYLELLEELVVEGSA